jgi:hypothetical protein
MLNYNIMNVYGTKNHPILKKTGSSPKDVLAPVMKVC